MQLDCCDYAILGARTSGLDRGQTGKISVVSTFACDWTVVRQVNSTCCYDVSLCVYHDSRLVLLLDSI